MNQEEYLKLADKYESNEEVKRLVVFTYEGAKIIYLARGFFMGMTFGLVLATAVAGFVLIIN